MKVIYHPLTKLMRQDGQDTDESDIPSMISKIMKCFKNLFVSSFCLCSIFLLFILRQLPLVLYSMTALSVASALLVFLNSEPETSVCCKDTVCSYDWTPEILWCPLLSIMIFSGMPPSYILVIPVALKLWLGVFLWFRPAKANISFSFWEDCVLQAYHNTMIFQPLHSSQVYSRTVLILKYTVLLNTWSIACQVNC